MKKFSNYIEEMSMSVTLKPKKNNMYKVTKVGSKMKKHGGIKTGEKFHDREIDGMHDSGIKVKYESNDSMQRMADTWNDHADHKHPKVQKHIKAAEKAYNNQDHEGFYNHTQRAADHAYALKKKQSPVKEAIQRRMDRKTIIATDPATGRKVVKVAPKKEVEIGKGKMEHVQPEVDLEKVNELASKTLKNYIRKAASPVNKPSAINLASKGGFKLGRSDGGDLDAGEKEDRKAFNRGRGIQRAAKKLYSRTNEELVKEISDKLKMNYIKKANQDISDKEKIGLLLKKPSSTMKKDTMKRRVGVKMAASKLGEDNIQELDTKTLANYQRKAGAQYKRAKVDSDERTAYKPFSVKGGRAADAAEKLKNKRGKGLAQSKKVLDKRYSDKQVKMGKGVAFDKRYKGGNMTGASKAINKIKKGLADHPKVANALRRANEEYNKGE